jgi:DNA-binding response OmpR family regulator
MIQEAFAAGPPALLRINQTHLLLKPGRSYRAMSGHDKPRILCVSRSAFQLRTICSAIGSRDYEAISATTPEQAVAVCVNNKLAAVVLDSEFVIDGWSAAKTFKMINPHLPVVLLGWRDEKDTPHGVDAIADTYSNLAPKLEALLKGR